MLLDTQISMPSQDPLAENKFLLSSRELRKWLKNLPYVDQDQAVQQFYDGLKRSNRQAHATKQRLTAIEIMRPVAHDFLKQQRKYLLSQPFPLTKKATEILKLQQNILNELAVAYKIIIQETVNRDNQLSNKKLITCVHHAIYYQLEQYLTLAQVYSEPPQSFWKDLCQLYEIAEHFELTDIQIKNEIDEINPKSSPKFLFTQACLLSLSNLHTYGHGEAGKIAAYLKKSSQLVKLSDIVPTDSKYIFYINLALANPVRLIPDEEIPISSKNRYIDAEALIDDLKKISNLSKKNKSEPIIGQNELNKSLARRLLKKLSSKPKRASKRAVPPKGRLHVVIGLHDAMEVLQNGHTLSNEISKNEPDKKQNLELLPIENHRSTQFLNLDSNQEENSYEVSSENAWDWISRGNVISNKITSEPEKGIEDELRLKPVVQTWDISNASKGGYCLNSSNTCDYQSQVGDIILLRLENKLNDPWRLGVIRWMQSLSQQGVKMGIETLHGNIVILKLIAAQQQNERFSNFDHALQISEETRNGVDKTLIIPPNAASDGDSLVLQRDNKKINVVLQHKLEQTISFTRFSYSELPMIPSDGDL